MNIHLTPMPLVEAAVAHYQTVFTLYSSHIFLLLASIPEVPAGLAADVEIRRYCVLGRVEAFRPGTSILRIASIVEYSTAGYMTWRVINM